MCDENFDPGKILVRADQNFRKIWSSPENSGPVDSGVFARSTTSEQEEVETLFVVVLRVVL